MSARRTLGSVIRAIGRFPGIKVILYQPAIRSMIQNRPGFRFIYGKGWDLLHPFDRIHGTDTSGFIASADLPSSPHDTTRKHVYAGSQPSIIRFVLTAIPHLESFTFIDLGCGKGRPLLVASEFPFVELVGVELSPGLARDAGRNAAVVRRRFPGRPPMRIETTDAGTFPFPPGNLVVFLYNPFGKQVILKVVAGIEAALRREKRSMYVVYYNPVHGDCFDASRVLSRYFAATLPYAEEERGYGPDLEDTVVIWQAGGATAPHPGAEAKIEITSPDTRAELAQEKA